MTPKQLEVMAAFDEVFAFQKKLVKSIVSKDIYEYLVLEEKDNRKRLEAKVSSFSDEECDKTLKELKRTIVFQNKNDPDTKA